MKLHTRWERVKGISIIGQRFFDAGEYGLGYFIVQKAYKCKEFCQSATAPDGSHWFDKRMIVVKTCEGIIYKIPFIPWAKVYTEDGSKSFADFYNENPW